MWQVKVNAEFEFYFVCVWKGNKSWRETDQEDVQHYFEQMSTRHNKGNQVLCLDLLKLGYLNES